MTGGLSRALTPLVAVVALLTSACSQTEAALPSEPVSEQDFRLIDRLTWGANASEVTRFQKLGRQAWIDAQFAPSRPIALPAPVQAVLDAMPIAQASMGELATKVEADRVTAFAVKDPQQRRALLVPTQLANREFIYQSDERSLLRDVYSPDQLREQMTWFWFNHFNVRIANPPLPTMVRDYEELTIRPRALGRFCDLVDATLRHPAMLFYLGNQANTADKINENYARELMELHTMGVGSGYSQKDVQELARILTGARADLSGWPPAPAPAGGFRDGLFVFDPALHDTGRKTLLGAPIKSQGYAEISEATVRLCRHPATAQRISLKIARYMVADVPPPALVDRMAGTFQATDGDISAVLRTMIASPEFTASLGTLYKDPQHYVLSALRLGFDGRIIAKPRIAAQMLAMLGQARFTRVTPDGFSLDAAEWNSSGQLATRFNIATMIGGGGRRLFTAPDGSMPPAEAPPIKATLAATGIHAKLAPDTLTALSAARRDSEWNSLFLSSPEFMRR